MARRFRRKNRIDAISEINMTPLIDLAFSLLIIFMITAPLLEQTIELDLPKEAQRADASTEEQIVQTISISKEGFYYWGEHKITEQELGVRLLDIAGDEVVPVFHIRGDASVAYQKVVTVLDLLKKNNLSKINLDTEVL